MFRHLAIVLMSFSVAPPATACWQTPTPECWEARARAEALAWVAAGPRLEQLATLIDWGLLPRDAESARALLGDLAPTNLTPEQLSDDRLVFGLYRLVEQTGDAPRLRLWYEAIPPATRRTAGLEPPAGHPDGAFAQTELHNRLMQVSAALQQGHPNDAIAALADASVPTAFLGWKELARHAIATGDLVLLSSAIRAMQQALDTPPPSQPALSPKAQVEALLAAQQDYAQSGDPDALVAVLEQLSMPGFGVQPMPPEAALAPALADLWLRQQGWAGVLPDDALPALMARLQAAETPPDPAITLLSARSALRLGLEPEARALVDLAFAYSAFMPDPLLKDLPAVLEDTGRSDLWLDWMLARFQHDLHGPAKEDLRRMFNLASTSLDLTRALVRQGRLDEARRFAAKTEAALVPHFPLQTKMAEYLFPPEEAIARITAVQASKPGGQSMERIAWRLIRAGQRDAGLTLLEAAPTSEGVYSLVTQFPDPDHRQRQRLYALIDHAMPNPILLHSSLILAARHGDWLEAEHYFTALLALSPPEKATLRRIGLLLALATLPQGGIAEMPQYAYEDWAL